MPKQQLEAPPKINVTGKSFAEILATGTDREKVEQAPLPDFDKQKLQSLESKYQNARLTEAASSYNPVMFGGEPTPQPPRLTAAETMMAMDVLGVSVSGKDAIAAEARRDDDATGGEKRGRGRPRKTVAETPVESEPAATQTSKTAGSMSKFIPVTLQNGQWDQIQQYWQYCFAELDYAGITRLPPPSSNYSVGELKEYIDAIEMVLCGSDVPSMVNSSLVGVMRLVAGVMGGDTATVTARVMASRLYFYANVLEIAYRYDRKYQLSIQVACVKYLGRVKSNPLWKIGEELFSLFTNVDRVNRLRTAASSTSAPLPTAPVAPVEVSEAERQKRVEEFEQRRAARAKKRTSKA